MGVLPDINVLLPLVYGGHLHHAAAVAWLSTVPEDGDIILCRVTQLGLLRLINHPVVLGIDAQSGREVWRTWDALLADARFRFADEPAGLDERLRSLSSAFVHEPKRWQDACLAAFALAADAELVTFDRGFQSFPGLRHRILDPGAPLA
jgi:toxin-antitoxin system PIN domain toxin